MLVLTLDASDQNLYLQKHRKTMKIASFLSFVAFLTLSGMSQAGVTKSTTSYQGASASAGWSSSWNEDFCVYGSAYVSATEGTYTQQTDGKPIGTPVHDIYFNYWFYDQCTYTYYSGYASASNTGNIDISVKKNNAGATVSAVLEGTATSYSWVDYYNWSSEPLSVSLAVTWSGCTLAQSGKSMSKYSSGNTRYTYKNADKYATACTLSATVSDIGFPLDPETAWTWLFEGQNMQVIMEKQT